jgi:hypothetical protein
MKSCRSVGPKTVQVIPAKAMQIATTHQGEKRDAFFIPARATA